MDATWDNKWAWPKEQCVMCGDDPKGGGVILGEDVPDKPNTPNNCELDWYSST